MILFRVSGTFTNFCTSSVAFLLVLFCAEPELEPQVCAAAGDRGVFA